MNRLSTLQTHRNRVMHLGVVMTVVLLTTACAEAGLPTSAEVSSLFEHGDSCGLPATLEAARNQVSISNNLGQDLSVSWIWRPYASQNIVFRLSGAVLNPGGGFDDLYGSESKTPYSVLANLLLTY